MDSDRGWQGGGRMSRPWMPLYVGDYIADTAHLTAAESGAYLHLIMHYWQKGGLPTDERLLARIAKMTTSQWEESRDVIREFFQDGWKHKRIEFELTEAARLSAAGKAGGVASGASRRSKRTTVERSFNDSERSFNDSRTICEALPSHSQPQETYIHAQAQAEALPTTWKLDEQDKAYARAKGWNDERIKLESDRFGDHARATGRRQKCWHAA